MRNLIGAVGLLLALIGLPGTIDSLSQWRGWAKFLLGDSYGPICVLAGLALLPVFFFWDDSFHEGPAAQPPSREPTSRRAIRAVGKPEG